MPKWRWLVRVVIRPSRLLSEFALHVEAHVSAEDAQVSFAECCNSGCYLTNQQVTHVGKRPLVTGMTRVSTPASLTHFFSTCQIVDEL